MMKWIWAHFRFWLRASICMLIDLVSSNSICVFEASPAARLRLRSPRFAAVCHGSQLWSALNFCLCFVFAIRCPVLSLLLFFSYSSRSGIWFLALSLLPFFVYFCLFVFRYSCCWCFVDFLLLFSLFCYILSGPVVVAFLFSVTQVSAVGPGWDPVGSRTGLTCLVSFFFFSFFFLIFLIILCLCFASSFLFSFVLFL